MLSVPILFAKVDSSHLYDFLIQQNPVFIEFYKIKPNIGGLVELTPPFIVFISVLCFLVAVIFITLVAPHFFHIQKVQQNMKFMSNKTKETQLMLYKIIGLQKVNLFSKSLVKTKKAIKNVDIFGIYALKSIYAKIFSS